MATMHPMIAGLSSAEYKEFCKWLRECAGMTISDVIRLPHVRQAEAYNQYLAELETYNPEEN